MQTFLKEILLNTLHENIPCLPEKALREREREREREGKEIGKKGEKKKRQNMLKTQIRGSFCLLTISHLNIHRQQEKMKDKCFQFNHRGM